MAEFAVADVELAAAFGATGVGGFTFTAVVLAGIGLAGGGFDDAALVDTMGDTAPPLAAGFTAG